MIAMDTLGPSCNKPSSARRVYGLIATQTQAVLNSCNKDITMYLFWSPRGTIGSESRDLYACSVVACSAEGDAARKARLGHCDDVVCSMRLRFPDAVYLDYSFQEIAKKKDLRLDLRLACGGKRKTVRPVFPQKTF